MEEIEIDPEETSEGYNSNELAAIVPFLPFSSSFVLLWNILHFPRQTLSLF